MRNSPLACSYAVPTSKLLIHRLNMTLRCHGDRYFHKILSEIGYCGLDPRINPLCSVVAGMVLKDVERKGESAAEEEKARHSATLKTAF